MADGYSALNLLSRSETIDVIESPLVGIWLREKAKREPIAFCRLVQDNTERLTRLWGKPEKRRERGVIEFVWGNEDSGVPFIVVSSPQGTRYFIHYPGGVRAFAADRKMGSAITGFLEKLLINLSGFSSK